MTVRETVEMRLELMSVRVSDVERSRRFYVERAGFVLDHDHTVGEEIRFVQLTPPGSARSISIGKGLNRDGARLPRRAPARRGGHQRPRAARSWAAASR